jgi:hypothetical protein
MKKTDSNILKWRLSNMRATRLSKKEWSQCNDCKHRDAYLSDLKTTRCDAFPNQDIPKEIRINDFIHTKPYPGDNGILFEAVEGRSTVYK